MIDWLRFAKSAYFYKKRKKLPKRAVTQLFRDIRQTSESPSRTIFNHVKQPMGTAFWSATAFFYERDPAFLEAPEHFTKERVCAFLLLAEYREHAVLFKS